MANEDATGVSIDEQHFEQPRTFTLRSLIKEGKGEREPALYVELEHKRKPGVRIMLDVSLPRHAALFASSRLRVGGDYEISLRDDEAGGKRYHLRMLPSTGPFPHDMGEFSRFSAEDMLAYALYAASEAIHRVERVTGRDVTEVTQSTAATGFIAHIRDKSGLFEAEEIEAFLQQEKAAEVTTPAVRRA